MSQAAHRVQGQLPYSFHEGAAGVAAVHGHPARSQPRSPFKARALAAQLSAEAWTRHRVPGNSRCLEHADFAIRRVVTSRDSLPCPPPHQADPPGTPDWRAGPSRPASGKAGNCSTWATTRAAARRTGIVT